MSRKLQITSPTNQQIKFINLLQNKSSSRKKEGLFVVEGVKIFVEAPKELIHSIYVSDSFIENLQNDKKGFTMDIYGKVMEKLSVLDYVQISDEVAKHISDTVNTQGIFTVVNFLSYDLSSLIDARKKQIFLVLDGLSDPGNMGTIIRTAEGAGVSAVLMNKECVDIYNPKVTRSTMGSIFRVPFIIEETLLNGINILKKNGVITYAAHLNGSEYYLNDNLSGSVAIFIGNEARGLSDNTSSMADKLIKIPMEGQLESLNASTAAAILMYEAKRKISL
jgi:RNA methyltransferase, TrmH family